MLPPSRREGIVKAIWARWKDDELTARRLAKGDRVRLYLGMLSADFEMTVGPSQHPPAELYQVEAEGHVVDQWEQ